MEQLQEEVPEVKEEEEEEALIAVSRASDQSGGPDSSLPSSSYIGEWNQGSSSVPGAAGACSRLLSFQGQRTCLGEEFGLF